MSGWKVIDHREVPSGGLSSIEFTSIPQSYDDLLVVCSLRQNTRNSPNGGFAFQIIPNNSTASISGRSLRGDGSATLSQTLTDLRVIGGSSSDTANTFGNSKIYIPNYSGNTAKSFSMDAINETNATDAYPHIVAGLWGNTAPITSLKLQGLFGDALVQYSSATLYGIKKGSSGGVTVS